MDGRPQAERFLADRMVGRLGRWLRAMGVDCAPAGRLTAAEVLAKAAVEGRALLTRDTGLLKRRSPVIRVLIESNFIGDQLRQFLALYPRDPLAAAFTRCVECNEALQDVAREALGDEVPVHVRRTQAVFKRCPSCHRIYWGATHRRRMEVRLRAIRSSPPRPP